MIHQNQENLAIFYNEEWGLKVSLEICFVFVFPPVIMFFITMLAHFIISFEGTRP